MKKEENEEKKKECILLLPPISYYRFIPILCINLKFLVTKLSIMR